MRQILISALAAIALALAGTPDASAQTIAYSPVTGQPYVQYYTPYTYGTTAYYTYPNTGYVYSYPATSYYAPGSYYSPAYAYSYPYSYGSYYSYPYGTYSAYPYGSYYGSGWGLRGWRY
jgi:hypothetical protein